MTLIEYYLRYLQELAAGTRKPPEGMTLTEEEPMRRAAQMQEQIQAMGIPEFVRRCAAADGETIPQKLYDEFKPEDLMATLSALISREIGPEAEEADAEAERVLKKAQEGPELPEEDAPPHIEEPDGPRNAYEVLLDCCCLNQDMFFYLIDVLKRKAEMEFQKLALVTTRKAFTIEDFLWWFGTKEQRAGQDELVCVTIMDACLDRLAAENQRELIAALISGDKTTFELFRCDAPELQHLPRATFEWFDKNYLSKLYPIRYMMKFNGVSFPKEELK